MIFAALENDEPRFVVTWAGPGRRPAGFLPQIFASRADALEWIARQVLAG
jgi:hypothetical protein